MQVISTIAEFRRARAAIQGSLGFVPTMGYLHEGHATLARRARTENEAVAASIFVNPTQFGPDEDFAKYPRALEHDLALLEQEGVALVFHPTVAEMYSNGFDTFIDVGKVAQPLEGSRRPGHFRGVATVVAKLFNLVQPTRAYFGQKDAQQVAVIKRMVRDLDMPVEIVVVPTVREPDGLAMSSRNVYLDPHQREAALCLWRGLKRAQELWTRGQRDADALRESVRREIGSEELARIDYVSLADAESLEELHGKVTRPALLSLAVQVGQPHLLDNVILA